MTEYPKARELLINLQFLKNLAKKALIFLDYSAATKGIFSKTYKFKIYYKYDGTPFNLSLVPQESHTKCRGVHIRAGQAHVALHARVVLCSPRKVEFHGEYQPK